MRKYIIIFIMLLCMVLSSCSGIYNGVCGALGIDYADYAAEAVVTTLSTDDEEALRLAANSCIVCYGDRIVPFDTFSDHGSDYIDIVLNYLCGTFYSRYAANRDMMEKFSLEYPELNMSSLIPLSDYENTVYTYFGGSKKAVVSSTVMYSYLNKINAFVLVGQSSTGSVGYTLHEACETKNTYRLTVSFEKNGDQLGTYEIVYKKRDAGEPYIWRLTKSNKIYAG